MQPLSRVLLNIKLLDVCGFEVLWVLDVVEDTAEGWKAIGVVCKMRSVSCIDDVPCIHPGIGYFFEVADAIVVAVRLRSWSLDCWWLSTPRAMTTCDFLLLLVSLVLLL
jgi:hypothetical protein